MADLSAHLTGENGNVKLTEGQRRTPKREGILDTATANREEGFPSCLVEKGKVCFTHFIYLSDGATITPDLLRYAYRRTAAIVVDAGRRGIDWIIPVRADEDEFVGLVGPDKNRMRDNLSRLGYSKLMDETADDALRGLRGFTMKVPPAYQSSVPLTYGVSTATNTAAGADASMDMS